MFSTRNFSTLEVLQSCTKDDLLELLSSPIYTDNFALALDYLQKIRDSFDVPIFISSSFRNAFHNRLVGGVDKSDHMRGLAFDVYCGAVEDTRLLEYFISQNMSLYNVRFVKLYKKASYYVHVSFNDFPF